MPPTQSFPPPGGPRGRTLSTPIPALSMPKNKRTAVESRSQSPAKNSSDQRETRASAASSSQAGNRIPLAAITRNQNQMIDPMQQWTMEKQVTKRAFAKM